MGTTPPITTNNPQNTRSTKPDQARYLRLLSLSLVTRVILRTSSHRRSPHVTAWQAVSTSSFKPQHTLASTLARSRPNRLGSKPTTKSTSAQSSPSKGSCTNLKPSARPSPHSTSTAARTPQSPIAPRPGEPSSTTPPSTPTEQSPSRSTTARAFDRCGEWLHKLLAIISIRQLRRPDQELRNPDFFHTRRRVGSEFSLSHVSEACLGTP